MSKEPQEYELPVIPGQPVPQTVPQSHDATVVSTQPGPWVTMADTNTKPENYLALSLFTLLCCSWMFGIIALIMSLQVDIAWYGGDVARARRASFLAKQFSTAGIVCGSMFYVIDGISAIIFVFTNTLRGPIFPVLWVY